ncbi:MAG: T9SS type A sorting domain-containing protein, partial [bacterium]|nr:T9SS type A sorting domain-containing protein [bacterium]
GDGKENVRDMVPESRTTVGISSRTPNTESRTPTNGTPIAQSPLPIAELLLPTSLGELRTALPSVYQVSANGTRNEIDAAFHLTDQNTFGIVLPNGYQPNLTLRIDPLIYSTFLGGSGNDFAYTVSNDGLNGIIVSGYTASVDFPTSIGAIDTSIHGLDCFVSRLNLTNQQLIYSTYLGGSNGDYGTAIANESNGNCTVTGITMSTDFPTTPGVGDLQLNGTQDCFVAHLNSTGSQLLYSTYLGGSYEEQPYDIATDNTEGVFVVGMTNSRDYPTTNNAWCRFFIGGSGFPTWGGDCFITHINSTGSQLLYSSFFGGTLDEVCGSIYVSPHLEVTVTGWTTSSDFPTTPGVYDSVYSSNNSRWNGECFISCFDSSGSNLLFSTFLGNDSASVGKCILRETNGDIIVAGEAYGNFPVTQVAYDTTFNGEGDYGGDLFIARLNSNASQLLQSTYLGGSISDQLQGMEKLENGQIAVFGTTYSSDLPTTTTAISRILQGSTDSYVSILNNSLSQLQFSTYLGGTNRDDARGCCGSGESVICVGGTSSTDFPRTTSGFDTSYNGGSADCFICLFQTDSTGVTSSEQSIPNEYLLSQNYPNPFNTSTTISYSLSKPGMVELRLFDITGREVATLVNQKQQTGSYRVTFDGKNLSSGTYFMRMQAGEFVKTQKMVLLK